MSDHTPAYALIHKAFQAGRDCAKDETILAWDLLQPIVRELGKYLTTAVQPSPWQPIETAPRDATVLIAVERRNGRPVFDGESVVTYPAYIDEHGAICCCGTYVPSSGFEGPHFRTTHWMPLPVPPSPERTV